MAKSILTANQLKFLEYFSKNTQLSKKFYLTGGTALSEFYLKHRYSEDLDFFSEQEFRSSSITPYVTKSKEFLKFKAFDYQNSFNRNIFQLVYSNKSFLKVEFTYFPFIQVEKPKLIKGVLVDSLIDIAVNKLFTIHQQPRGRDFFDLYVITQKQKWNIEELIRKMRIKFDTKVDYLQLGTQFMKVIELLDDPILKDSKVTKNEIEIFFKVEASKFSSKIFK